MIEKRRNLDDDIHVEIACARIDSNAKKKTKNNRLTDGRKIKKKSRRSWTGENKN